jgi:hypothetical protein
MVVYQGKIFENNSEASQLIFSFHTSIVNQLNASYRMLGGWTLEDCHWNLPVELLRTW